MNRASKLFTREQPARKYGWVTYPYRSGPLGLLDADYSKIEARMVSHMLGYVPLDIVRGQARAIADSVCKYSPQRWGQDERRCMSCGLTWAIDEDRPPCPNTRSPQEDDPQ